MKLWCQNIVFLNTIYKYSKSSPRDAQDGIFCFLLSIWSKITEEYKGYNPWSEGKNWRLWTREIMGNQIYHLERLDERILKMSTEIYSDAEIKRYGHSKFLSYTNTNFASHNNRVWLGQYFPNPSTLYITNTSSHTSTLNLPMRFWQCSDNIPQNKGWDQMNRLGQIAINIINLRTIYKAMFMFVSWSTIDGMNLRQILVHVWFLEVFLGYWAE